MATLLLAVLEEDEDGKLKYDYPSLYRKIEWEKPAVGEEFTLELSTYEVVEVVHVLRGNGATPYILVNLRLDYFQMEELNEDNEEIKSRNDLQQLWFSSNDMALIA